MTNQFFKRMYQNKRDAWGYVRRKKEAEKKPSGYWHNLLHENGHCICFVRNDDTTQVIFSPRHAWKRIETIRSVASTDEKAHEDAWFQYRKALSAE